MFGKELSKGRASFNGKTYYFLFGHAHVGNRVRAFHLRRVLKNFKAPKNILDAGCGDGSYSFYLSRCYPDANIMGVDMDHNLIEECNYIREKTNRKNVKFEIQSLERFYKKNTFDFICCIDVLQYIVEDATALVNLKNALKDGGALLIHVPILNPKVWIHTISLPIKKVGFVRNGYGVDKLKQTLERNGLNVLFSKKTFGFFGAVARDLSYQVDKVKYIRQVLKLFFAPIFIFMAYLDSVIPVSVGQGILICAKRPKED